MMTFTYNLHFVCCFSLELNLKFFAGFIRGDPAWAIFVNKKPPCSFDKNVVPVAAYVHDLFLR